MKSLLLLLTAFPLHAASPIIKAPQAPASISSLPSPFPVMSGISTPNPLPLTPPPLSPLPFTPSLAPTALRAAPLLAAALDPRASVEAAAAGGEKLTALLQADPLSRVRVSEVVPGVLHLRFPSQRLMASTMVRFQETYESPKFRGKTFTRDEFRSWYASQKPHGRYSYAKDWDGFNIPSRVLRRFQEGAFDPLDPRERSLLALLSPREGRFYVIATSGRDGNPPTLRHEVAHGLWYTRPDYRRRAQALLRTVNLKSVFRMLERLGYHPSVWLDEAHAWLGDRAADVRSEGLNPKPYASIRKRLRALQKEYVSGLF